MTISSSLNAGVAGLKANATRLATISDNIANASTYGYKRVESEFSALVTGSNEGSYTAGGVRATNQRLIDQSGSLISTQNSTDLAIRGGGMLPVTSRVSVESANATNQMMLTTTGSFRPDSEGYLVTESGLVLMAWPANSDGTIPTYPRDSSDGLEPVQINMTQFSADPTTAIDLSVNLPATETESTASGDTRSLSVEYFDNLGGSETLDIDFVPTIPGAGSSNEWTMVIKDSASGGAVIGEYTLTFNDDRTSGGTLASVATVSGGAYDPATGAIVVNVAGGPMELAIGELNDPESMSQLGSKFAPVVIAKDGSSVGNVIGINVDANGNVHTLFDTGVTRRIYQIPLVDLPNPNGMQSLDNQTYIPTNDSGPFFLWDAGEGPTGQVVSFAREESTTDVAGELTSMIQTQRAYSSNAKVIQTVDEMLQETTNIKR